MRLLGVDFGSQRIGLAVGDSQPRIFRPLPALNASGTLAKDALSVAEIARKEEADLIVVGVPRGVDGSKQEKTCMLFADKLRQIGLQVDVQDEAFSSVEAEYRMEVVEVEARKRANLIDSVSAIVILDRFCSLDND
jgi:putative Holliday junction resolvase